MGKWSVRVKRNGAIVAVEVEDLPNDLEPGQSVQLPSSGLVCKVTTVFPFDSAIGMEMRRADAEYESGDYEPLPWPDGPLNRYDVFRILGNGVSRCVGVWGDDAEPKVGQKVSGSAAPRDGWGTIERVVEPKLDQQGQVFVKP